MSWNGQTVIDMFVGSFQSNNSMVRLNGQNNVATVKGSIRYLFTKLPRVVDQSPASFLGSRLQTAATFPPRRRWPAR